MSIQHWRRWLPGIALIACLMTMVLSCGGGAEAPAAAQMAMDSMAAAPAAMESAESRPRAPQPPAAPAAAMATRAPVAAAMPTAAPAQPTVKLMAVSEEDTEADGQESAQGQTGRQLIVEAWISLEVSEIDAIVRQVEALADQRGGWVESAEIFGEAGYRSASLRVRVPADRLDNAMDALRGLGRVTDEGISSTDVTERLIDNEARLTAWYAQEERLVTLLENAPTVEDIIQIEQRIAQVRSDIEHVEATQRNLTNRVATSLITVNLSLPERFAAEPPHGVLTLTVGDPSATADAVITIVDSLDGYVGEKREYDEGGGQTVRMVAYVRPADLSGLMDYAATLGEATERRLDSVGPAPASEAPNAPLTLSIHSNIDLGGSLSLGASDPLAVAREIRARAEAMGGFVDQWHESRHDDDRSVSMELVVKSSDLRDVMDFGAGLGETEYWEYNAAGQKPADDAPNARLSVSVSTTERYIGDWIIAAVVAVVVVGLVAAVLVALLLLRRRRNRRTASHAVASLETDIAG